MFIREVTVDEFRNLKEVHLGPFTAPTAKSDILVLAGANGGGKSSILELINYAVSNAFGYSYANRRNIPNRFRFDVSVGLSTDELRLIREYLDTHKDYAYQRPALEQLLEKRFYLRHFRQNVEAASPVFPLYDQCHQMVTNILRQHLRRPMGFFLKADRFYPIEGFQWQNRLFAYDQMAAQDHIWGMSFAASENQYRDMYDFLVQMRFHYFQSLGQHFDALRRGEVDASKEPADPILPYEKLLGQLLPGYSFGRNQDKGAAPSNLFIQLPDKQIIPFHDLSSGEKEVFFLLSFFIRHNVANSVVSIDEPELHLHPDLARRLLRLMLSLKPGNQIWLATHNAEIIDEAGRDKTVYIGRGQDKSDVVPGSSEPEAALLLRSLFGVSGYIGVAKTMVFLEGEGASADRKTFGWLFGEQGGSVKLIPVGGVDNQTRINAAVLAILDSTFGVCQFFLIRDRDYLTSDMANAYAQRSHGRLYVLDRNQIENYLLNPELLSHVLNSHYDKATAAEEVDRRLMNICRRISGEVLRDMTSFRLNASFRPQDFGLGKFLEKTPIVDESNAWIPDRVTAFEQRTQTAIDQAIQQTAQIGTTLTATIEGFKTEVLEALTTDRWRTIFPGKRLITELAQSFDLKNEIGFLNSLIKEMAASAEFLHPELASLRDTILRGSAFSAKT